MAGVQETTKRKHTSDDEILHPESTKNPEKKIKTSSQTFLPRYQEKYPFLIASRKGKHFAHCTLCKHDFSVRSSGIFDCKRHAQSASHKQFADAAEKQSKLSVFLTSGNTDGDPKKAFERSVMRAEAMICHIIADSNLPIATSDTLTTAMKAAFPDSKIAQRLQCCRSKATAIIKEMAAQTSNDLQRRMQVGPYTVSTDGSNDTDSKQFPLVIRSINADTGLVTSELLSVPICQGSATGQNIFNLINAEFQARRIPWEKCLSLGCDNANVMTGQHKGVFAFVKEKQSQVFLAGCTLHMVHNAAKKAATHMPPFETVLTDIFFYFDKSCERKSRFKEMQDIFEVEHRKVIKHVPTRWLSISKCLQRLEEQWDALKVFFSEEKESSSKASKTSSYAFTKVEGVFNFVKSPTNHLYLLFLLYTVKVFDQFLLTFQSDEPMVHKLKRGMERLLKTILCRFVKADARRDKSVLEVEYKNPENMVSNQELGIGEDALNFLEKKNDKYMNHLRESRVAEFYRDVKSYFVELVDYLKSRLPFGDPLLEHAEVADVSLQKKATTTSLRYFLTRFPSILPPGSDTNTIIEQFTEYQETDFSNCIAERMDETWSNIGKLTTDDCNFHELSLVMRGILTIPHSSAHCERVFSCVRKNRTAQRASLADSTVESLLVLKSSPLGPVEAVKQMKDDDLDALKSAYANSLKAAREV